MPQAPKELNIELAAGVQAQMDADHELAAAVKDFIAIIHQACHGVQTGQYKTMDDAMEALTGNRPKKLDPETGEEIEGASFQDDWCSDEDEDED